MNLKMPTTMWTMEGVSKVPSFDCSECHGCFESLEEAADGEHVCWTCVNDLSRCDGCALPMVTDEDREGDLCNECEELAE